MLANQKNRGQKSAALGKVLQLVVETVAASTRFIVLLLGETGTGKELIARAIHNLSRRKERKLVKLNCAAIPTGLLESELFGHERGAFTGAIARKVGRVELADRGSLFLDEIGDIPLELQPKLLRVLQEREFERLGSTRTKKVDVRVVAATHRDLETMIVDKQFRSDLYYQVERIPDLHTAPAGTVRQIYRVLVGHFAQHAARKDEQNDRCAISSKTMQAFSSNIGGPGNIRELENVIERAVILSPGPVLRVRLQDLPGAITPGENIVSHPTLAEAERRHILATLKETRWALSGPRGAAARLGMKRSTLHFRMKKLGITRSLNASFDS